MMDGSNLRSQPVIEVRDLWKEYPAGDETVVALRDITLNIHRGEICCIFGPSGSGKSTLLNQLSGLESPPGRGTDRRRPHLSSGARHSLRISVSGIWICLSIL